MDMIRFECPNCGAIIDKLYTQETCHGTRKYYRSTNGTIEPEHDTQDYDGYRQFCPECDAEVDDDDVEEFIEADDEDAEDYRRTPPNTNIWSNAQ